MAKQSGVEISLTANQLTALTAEAAGSNSANSGTVYHGYSLAQFLATVNAPETTANPQSQGQVALPVVSLDQVNTLLSIGLESAAYTGLTAVQQGIAGKLFDQAGNAISSGATSISTIAAANWLNKYVAYGLLTQAQVNAVILEPDPNWQSRCPVGPPTQRLFGLPLIFIEAGDCATLSFPLA